MAKALYGPVLDTLIDPNNEAIVGGVISALRIRVAELEAAGTAEDVITDYLLNSPLLGAVMVSRELRALRYDMQRLHLEWWTKK